jgi:hypothetical protein
MLYHFPEPDNRRVADPVGAIIAGDRFHLRTAPTAKFAVRREIAERAHQGRAMLVPARFARDEVESLSHAKPN